MPWQCAVAVRFTTGPPPHRGIAPAPTRVPRCCTDRTQTSRSNQYPNSISRPQLEHEFSFTEAAHNSSLTLNLLAAAHHLRCQLRCSRGEPCVMPDTAPTHPGNPHTPGCSTHLPRTGFCHSRRKRGGKKKDSREKRELQMSVDKRQQLQTPQDLSLPSPRPRRGRQRPDSSRRGPGGRGAAVRPVRWGRGGEGGWG